MNNNFICWKCGHIYKGHQNLFGKVCLYCNHFTPPDEENTLTHHNRIAKETIKIKILEYLRKKYGDNNAN